ncbi:hypothetical protein [Raineyella sp. LH-20]|uniref:hypothetical protein n=1 Tax=Raineyella sp. LH-20 TaxID=3081204 RepID=UPI0029544D90|nr:hypothetical protein [Raineyella sp. LH-20]WOP18830.1 hypothetical protein R0146_00725 [Raineyella sp. LH-20]
MTSEKWDRYERWTAAIADVVYPLTDSPGPVYLDLEEDIRRELAHRMGIASDAVLGDLAVAVRGALDLTGGPADVLRGLTGHLRLWGTPGRQDPPPPVLGFLAALCMAAENMAAGDGVASTNFYYRLAELLELDDHQRKLVEQAYRSVGETYWRALDHWLRHHQGNRGLSTIVAAKPRFVGYPIAQAMIRAADRERLISFFEDSGLPPGAVIDAGQLRGTLEAWIGRRPSPATANLLRLWSSGRDAQRSLLENASAALAAWDGRVARGDAEHGAGGRLALQLSIGTFPKKRLGISVLAFLPEANEPRCAQILAADGARALDLTPSIPGALGMADSSAIETASILEGRLTIVDSLSDKTLTRQPRRLVAFRHDEATGRWIEADRVMLTQDLVLVCYDALLPRVTAILDAAARPGWRRMTADFPGIPPKWTVITGVELFRPPGNLVPSGLTDLQVLVPLATTQLTIAGGFRLPVKMRNVWHVAEPPEIRAVTDRPEPMRLVLRDRTDATSWDDDSQILEQWSDDGTGAMVVDLVEADLGVGDYEMALYSGDDADEATTVITFHLRDGDSIDTTQWDAVDSIGYTVAAPLGSLGAGTASDGATIVGATVLDGPAVIDVAQQPRTALPALPLWSPVRSGAVARRPISVTVVPKDSCLYTGAHIEQVEQVPLDRRGYPTVPYSKGTCRKCGLERWYPTSYRRNVRAHELHQAEKARHHATDVSQLEAMLVADTDRPSWDLVLDALFHAGGGSWALFERLARHVQASGIFVDQLARALESLGHIDIQRGPDSLRPVAWEVSPSVLAKTSRGYFLSGYWPDGKTNHQADLAERGVGGILREWKNAEGPSSWYFDRRPDVVVDGVEVVEDAARRQCAVLPVLSRVAAGLPRVPVSSSGQLRWFDPEEARWVEADGMGLKGAYRMTRFSTIDAVRTEEDLDRGTMGIGNVQLTKHLASALVLDRPLMAYDAKRRALSVPLGAELPALYARAAVLCSGSLPVKEGRSMTYLDVPVDIAEHLAFLATH